MWSMVVQIQSGQEVQIGGVGGSERGCSWSFDEVLVDNTIVKGAEVDANCDKAAEDGDPDVEGLLDLEAAGKLFVAASCV